jgi:hypothetical protein
MLRREQRRKGKMKSVTATLATLIILALAWAAPGFGATFSKTFVCSGGFHIYYANPPVPPAHGFDYYFTPVSLDTTLAGSTVRITDLTVSMTGTSYGDIVNWDLETYIGNTTFGLPTGQFTDTSVDPVAGYSHCAPVYWHINPKQVSFTQSISAPGGLTGNFTLNEGLRAQMFFWTADIRNCNVTFDNVTLTVGGEIVSQTPEPSGIIALLCGVGGLGYWRVARRAR